MQCASFRSKCRIYCGRLVSATDRRHDPHQLAGKLRSDATRRPSPARGPHLLRQEERGVCVRIAFLDDSARPEPIRDGLGRLVALGAVAVDEAALDPWAEEFRGLRRRLKVPKGTEVKW